MPARAGAADSEKDVGPEKLQDVLVFQGRTLPPGALTYDQLYEQWKQLSPASPASETDTESARERLRYALAAEWPAQVESSQEGQRLVLSRPGLGDRVPALWLPGSSPAALVIHPQGIDQARGSSLVQDLVKAGRSVLLIDCFQTASAVAPRDRSHRYFSTFNRTDDQNRVQDILTALAFLSSRASGPVELYGLAEASLWSVFAAAVAPADVRLHADTAWFRGTDQDYLRGFSVPGIQRAGGISAALWLSNSSRSALP